MIKNESVVNWNSAVCPKIAVVPKDRFSNRGIYIILETGLIVLTNFVLKKSEQW